jgi:mycothiol synthase
MLLARLLQGFLVRPPTLDDAEAIVALLTTDANTVEYLGYSISNLLDHWQTPGFTKETDAWVVVSPPEQLVGYAFVQGQEKLISIVCEHPDYRGQGVWPFLFERVEERARQQFSSLPTNSPHTLSTAFNDTNELAKIYLEDKGYALIHCAWLMQIEMGARPPRPYLAEGITIRPFVPGHDERLAHKVTQDAFQLSEPEPFEEWEPKFSEENFDPTLWFFALHGNQAVGAVLCYNDDPNMGWVWSLGVRRSWGGQGIGMALLLHAFGEFYTRGKYRVGLDVNAENRVAIQLYTRAGMHRAREYYTYGKEIQML